MTEEQRNLCLDEIIKFSGDERSDWEGSSDQQLASGVLSAWHEYCLEQGLI
ncbi:hypothetical protein ACYPKM_02060 [Pseudomonas aeruginosa]